MMRKTVTLFALVGVLTGVAALAGPPAKDAKVTDVWTCPIEMKPVADHKDPAKGVVVGKYRVHFCCAGCPEAFAKLSPKDKLAKATAAAKADAAKKPATKS